MTAQQISKVWTVVSLALLYYALNTYLVTQGGQPIFGTTLIVGNRIPAAMMGIPICSALLLMSSLIGIDYARKGGPTWPDCIPVVGFKHINTESLDAKFYQVVMLTLLSVLPLFAIGHFWWVFGDAHAVTTKNPAVEIPGIWSWSALTSVNDPARICNIFHPAPEGSSAPPTCEGPDTLLPGLEPWFFVILTAAAAGATLRFWWLVFLAAPSKSARSQ
jgi:hypothetical protein